MPIPPGIFDTPFEAKDRGEYVREPLMDITLTQKYSSTAQLLETRGYSCNFGCFRGHLLMISHKQEGSAKDFISTDRFIIHYAGHLSRDSALLTPFAAIGYLHQIYAGAHRHRQQPRRGIPLFLRGRLRMYSLNTFMSPSSMLPASQ